VSITKDLLTPKEVAEYLQVAPETIYGYIKEGKLVASKLGRRYRISRETVELFLLVTSSGGGAQPRTFSIAQIEEWVEEDQIDQETRCTGENLLASLRQGS